jgi:uncharacterized RDD family membrane protein YckC
VLVPFAILAETLPYELTIRNEIVWLPGLWLYGTLATWRYGRTLGKALLDLEVVSINSRRPKLALAAAALRTGLYTVPLWIGVLLRQVGEELAYRSPGPGDIIATVGKVLGPLAGAWAIAALAWTSWRRPDKRTPWDRAAGTMVRYVRPAPA